jgi:hypothetical protein
MFIRRGDKKMRKACIVALLLCLFGSTVLAYTVTVSPTVAKRTRSDTGTPPGSADNHDSSKLTVRGYEFGQKSWIKFANLGSYDLDGLRAAVLTVVFIEAKTAGCTTSVSYVNDDCLDNIDWQERTPAPGLTWNNAPGNLTTDLALLDATKTTLIISQTFTEAPVVGQHFDIDVLAALQADTDGIVQFVLHNSNQNTNYGTWDHATVANRPYLTLTYPPLGADWPDPEDGAEDVPADLAVLDWVNPEPNLAGDPIYCDVYFGTEPNRPQMDMVTLGNDISSVALTAGNFPNYVPLTNNVTYYWTVDCHDPVKGVVDGEMWSFYVNNNQPPTNVSAGTDQVTWLDPNALVTLTGSASDDGLPNPPAALTYLWERTAGPTTAVINSANTAATTVNFTEAGDYTFRLTVSDSAEAVTDTVRVVVGTTPCDASHVFTGNPYNDGDVNQDCYVDLTDLQTLIIDDWLNCTNTLTGCN